MSGITQNYFCVMYQSMVWDLSSAKSEKNKKKNKTKQNKTKRQTNKQTKTKQTNKQTKNAQDN